ncbi:hypothetical protein [Bradyrhizobium sp. 151]|uniref:HTH domain-containing protein n=1 Tax=Bradyrhizobium sp. 151 TaxID=2782626 RepID=UPI001FF9E09B|nr:hypothetical protein [Bradyrhizobium sp. 151]MCK1658602.1 hypothetical protein [Bradyrhizobium sp. 151]
MGGFEPTHIRIPKNDSDFETKTVVLFKSILKDPSVKRLGRRGQGQDGVDVVGYRDGDSRFLVGIQCKLKGPKEKLTADEVREEVRKALKYKPALSEYFIVTSAPNDTKLDQLAQTLTKQQRARGRKIRIEVWGWGVLEERINEDIDAKNAFDPGWSPAVEATQNAVNQIGRNQRKQATADQIERLERIIKQQATFQPSQLPASYADDELNSELARIHRRRAFFEANTRRELSALAKRVADGDLTLANADLRADALERSARAHLDAESIEEAKVFHAAALNLNHRLDATLYEALILDAQGNTTKALQALRKIGSPDARGAIFNLLVKVDGSDAALKWVDDSAFQPNDLRPQGWLNVLIKRREAGQYQKALDQVESFPASFFSEFPALYSIRGNLRLAEILPADQKGLVFSGLPLNPTQLQIANDSASLAKLSVARQDFELLHAEADGLRLIKLKPYLDELILWLKLEDPRTRAETQAVVAEEIKDQNKTLWRVRLALAYGIPFNKEALGRHLVAQKQVGDWTDDERFAVFLLALYDENRPALADFFDQYRTEIFAKPQLDPASLTGIEIEALSRVGRFKDARKRIEAHRKSGHIDDDEVKHLLANLQSVEDGSEADRYRKLYETEGQIHYLRALVAILFSQKNEDQLAAYAPILARETKRVEDFSLALQALYAKRKYAELVVLCDELPQLYEMRAEFAAWKGWSCFSLGRLIEARKLARELRDTRNDSFDRELAINTAVETGDWGYLATILVQETKRISELETKDLIRLARLAFETDSPYVDTFRDAAIAKSPDAPEPYLTAYQLSVDRGEEYQESHAHEWFQKAVELSGEKGPIQSMPMREIVRRTSGWNKRIDAVSEELRQARIPLYLAARSLNRQPIEAFLGLALRNSRETVAKSKYPLMAFSGARPRVDLSGVRSIALDVTTLFTLEFLGILQKTLNSFDHVVVAPSTLSSLFFDKQFIRFGQPSQVAKAKYIKELINKGRLKLLKREQSIIPTSIDIDPELQLLLDTARATGAKVVRSAPVHKLHSFMEETVRLDAYDGVLVDTHAVMNFLSTKVDSSTARNAAAYLNHVDQGWTNGVSLDADSIVYLDQLSVTYLHHVGLLEKLTANVSEVYVSSEVESDCDAILQSAELSAELGHAVDRIRAAVHAAIEKGSLSFTGRRLPNAGDGDEVEEGGPSAAFPSIDILTDLTDVDVVICDDRFLNKELFWADGRRRVTCATTIDVITALNSRAVLSEQQRFDLFHRLRVAGYALVPIEPNGLKSELLRARIQGDNLEETPELREIRENLSISIRRHMFLDAETLWLDQSRLAIFQTLRAVWGERSISAENVAQADWLLRVLPDPLMWCVDPTNDETWANAVQKSAGQVGMLVAAPYVEDERQKKYSAWIEGRLATPTRMYFPWLWDKAFQVYVSFLGRLMEAEDAPPEVRKALRLHVLRTLSETMRQEVASDETARNTLNLQSRTVLTINGVRSVDLVSFNNCLRAALRGRKTFSLKLADNKEAKVKISLKPLGVVGVSFGDLQFNIPDAALLSESKSVRAGALRRWLSSQPLTAPEEKHWTDIVKSRALTDEEYGDLARALRATPETLTEIFARPQNLNPSNMVPDDLAYFERLVGPLATTSGFSAYVDGPLEEHRVHLLAKGRSGLRRLAYSGLSRGLIPDAIMSGRPLKEIEALLDANDPFSLIFGLEVCAIKVAAGETGAAQLGARFLERIFGDKARLRQRCELFAACTVVSMVRLRTIVKDRSVPLHWFRLAALTHAGVLTNALGGMSQTAEFLNWSINELGPSYTWFGIVDTSEAPRWDTEWIDPEYMKHELIGRCFNTLNLLVESKRPKSWAKIIGAETESLQTMMHAFYAGPMDDFVPQTVTDQQKQVYARLKSILRRRKSFKDAAGLETIAHTGAVGKPLSTDVLKLLERSDSDLTFGSWAVRVLRCCAYVAATTRNEKLAEAVVERCLRLVTPQSTAGEISGLVLVALRAIAAYEERNRYYETVGGTMANFAYRTPPVAAETMRLTLELLHRRDPRLIASLGRAMALLDLAGPNGTSGSA